MGEQSPSFGATAILTYPPLAIVWERDWTKKSFHNLLDNGPSQLYDSDFQKSDGVLRAEAVAQYKKQETDLQFQVLM